MGVGAALYMYDVVVKSSRSLSHLLMSSCRHCRHIRMHHCFINAYVIVIVLVIGWEQDFTTWSGWSYMLYIGFPTCRHTGTAS